MKLIDLNFIDGGIRLKLEYGSVPRSGDLSLNVLFNESIFKVKIFPI